MICICLECIRIAWKVECESVVIIGVLLKGFGEFAREPSTFFLFIFYFYKKYNFIFYFEYIFCCHIFYLFVPYYNYVNNFMEFPLVRVLSKCPIHKRNFGKYFWVKNKICADILINTWFKTTNFISTTIFYLYFLQEKNVMIYKT